MSGLFWLILFGPMLQGEGGIVSANKPFSPNFKQLRSRERMAHRSGVPEVHFVCATSKNVVRVPLS